jgi:hypothetical protein
LTDWRDYFSREELEKNFELIKQGIEPEEEETSNGSDSDPEEDLY